MEIALYALLGLIQGLTEFLPVSSSGHLVLAEHWLGINPPGVVLEVALHFATLIAVVVVYRHDIAELFAKQRWHYIGFILLATVITVAIVLPLKDWFIHITESEEAVRITGSMLLITALLLLLADFALRRHKQGKDAGWLEAALIGFAQALAAMPGISRSGATISTAIMLKIDRIEAARFSFLISVPVILGATILSIPDVMPAIDSGGLNTTGLAVAFIAALVSGIAAIYMVLWMLRSARLAWFSLYCGILGLVAILTG